MQFTLEMRTPAQKCEKFASSPFLGGSKSFKVIDVDKSKKPVTRTCYDEQHVYIYLQAFLH